MLPREARLTRSARSAAGPVSGVGAYPRLPPTTDWGRVWSLAAKADSTTCRASIGYTTREGAGRLKGVRIKRLLAPLLVAVAASMIGVPAAFADHGTIDDKVGDVKFDPPGRKADYDITRASWSVKHRRFIHTVSVRGRIGDPRTGFGPLPQLQIDVPNHPSAKAGCDYTVRAPAGDRGALSASDCPSQAAKRERGDGVSIKKVSRHTVKYEIREDVLGDPTAYQWRFDLPAKACRRCVYDRIPNNHDKWHILHHEPPPISPIKHVVIIYQENHSFDNVFGRYCVDSGTCDGATRRRFRTAPRSRSGRPPDVVPDVGHSTQAQIKAINGGEMNGWPRIAELQRAARVRVHDAVRPEPDPEPDAARRAVRRSPIKRSRPSASQLRRPHRARLRQPRRVHGRPARRRPDQPGAPGGGATRTWTRPGGPAPTAGSAISPPASPTTTSTRPGTRTAAPTARPACSPCRRSWTS